METLTKHNQNVFEAIASDRIVRQAVTRESHLMFFHVYFPHYVKFPIAEFQKDIFRITEDQSHALACIVAFRGSGKSTLVTFSYSLWAILGMQQKKFVLIICQTQAQAKQHMANLRHELESNPLLKSDLGPFKEEAGGEWAMSSLVFRNTNARVMIASIDQSIRGIRHYEHRPDLLILDDVEDLNSTRTLEGRSKIFDWFTREVVPLGDIGTRIIIVGNLLHEDSLVMRLRKKIALKELRGVYQQFPLLDEDGNCLWPGKFDAPEKIEALRQSVANELAWQQEYLLNIISDSTRVIFSEWIRRYKELPHPSIHPRDILVGVDLAISQRETADYTAIVTLKVYDYGKKMKVYVLPNPINRRMTFPQTIAAMAELKNVFKADEETPKFIIESNGFQEIYVNAVSENGCIVEGVKQISDKRSRLALTSHLIQNGAILFPERGAEELIAQLTGFGIEHHDDLADAFSIAVMKIIERTNHDRSFEAWMEFVEGNGGSPWI